MCSKLPLYGDATAVYLISCILLRHVNQPDNKRINWAIDRALLHYPAAKKYKERVAEQLAHVRVDIRFSDNRLNDD